MIECPAPLVLRKAAHRHPMHLFLSLQFWTRNTFLHHLIFYSIYQIHCFDEWL